MFGKNCSICKEKDRQIDFLQKQNRDLLDRLMSFNKDAFVQYQAGKGSGEPLYPKGVDAKGQLIDYKDIDLNKAQEEMLRGFNEEPLTVEEKPEEIKHMASADL